MMIKKYLVISVVSLVFLANTAFAQDSGQIIFKDTLYGTAIGALIGSAIYLADDDDFAAKFSTGVIIGAVGGLIYGLYETESFVEIENDKVKVAIPMPVIEIKDETVQYSASLLRSRF
jgi:hypothetical protein